MGEEDFLKPIYDWLFNFTEIISVQVQTYFERE